MRKIIKYLGAAALLSLAVGCDKSGIDKPDDPPPHVIPPKDDQPVVAQELLDTVERFESAKYGAFRYDEVGIMVMRPLSGNGVSFTDVDTERSATLVYDAVLSDSTLVNPRLTVDAIPVGLMSGRVLKSDGRRQWIRLVGADGAEHLTVIPYF